MNQNSIDPRVQWVREDFKQRVKARESLEKTWILNFNFYAGNQQSEVLPTGEITEANKRYYWQENEVYNHIAPIIEARLSKFSNIRASVSVAPSTTDSCDVETAKFSTKLLRSVEEENRFREGVSEATFWAELTGTAFYKVIWSPTKGRCLLPEEGLYEGDVDIVVCPPYEIYPDSLTAGDVDQCRSIIHAKAYPVSVVEDVWGVKPTPESPTVFSFDSISIGGGVNQKGRNKKVCSSEVDGYVTVLERYSLPDGENPEGRLIIVAGDKLLYDGILPFRVGENRERALPFVRQACISQPASFFGTSIIERMIPVQRAYNAVKNRKHEFFTRMCAGVLIAEEGSIDLDELEENGIEPGKVIVYRQGSNEPKMENWGAVPPEFAEEEDRLLSEFVSISGVSDFLISSGFTSNNVSGVALNLIIEQDSSRLSITTDNIRNAAKGVAKMILRLYKQYAGEKRLKRIYGENGLPERAYFSANEISCDDVTFDVSEESVNSAEKRKQIVRELFSMGLLSDKDGKLNDSSKVKMIEMLGLGNWESAITEEELQRKKAMRENIFCDEKAPEISEIDNHSIHISEHTKRLLEDNGELNEETKRRLMEHIRMHKDGLEKQNDNTGKTENK